MKSSVGKASTFWETWTVRSSIIRTIADRSSRPKIAFYPGSLATPLIPGVHIDYVPSLDDQKTAWDFIHFQGFLGAKMSLQFIWQGFDSILAAPLVIDLARFAGLALQNGEPGLMPQLASLFQGPPWRARISVARTVPATSGLCGGAGGFHGLKRGGRGLQTRGKRRDGRFRGGDDSKRSIACRDCLSALMRLSVVRFLKRWKRSRPLATKGLKSLADVPHLYAPEVTRHDLDRLRALICGLGIRVANINANTAVGYYGRSFWEPLFEPSLANPDASARRWRLDYSRKCVEMAAALECRNVSVTSGRPVPGIAPDRSIALLKASLEELLVHAGSPRGSGWRWNTNRVFSSNGTKNWPC